MLGFNATELFIILMIVLVVFGAGKLPKVMGDLGKGVKSFKEAMNEKEEAADKEPQPQAKMVEAEVTEKKEKT
ncbi:MAG: twin-arginine translocase TatA/TatE family subunit [Magnetococcales bacterium]|nr:twin-arginine translocase TatA/TatE family subunit [Magnetococcales bacterium]